MGITDNIYNSTNNKTCILSSFSTNRDKLLVTNYFLTLLPIHLGGFYYYYMYIYCSLIYFL